MAATLINRFDLPPRAWPAPVDAAGFADCVDYAARRDPYGDAVHTALGCVYLFCAGLSTATESIAFVLLVGYTILRLPNLWRGLAPIVAAPVAWALFALFAWAALSGAWAADAAQWRDALGGFRGLLIVPALYPIRSAWRLLLGSLIAGMTLQGAMQILQQLGLMSVRMERTDVRFAGLHTNPVQASLFEAVALMVALGWMRETRSWRTRGLLIACALFLAAGIAIAAGRAAIVGLGVAIPLLGVLLVRFHGAPWRRLLAIAAVAVVGASVVAGGVVALGSKGLRRQLGDVTALDDPRTSTGQRILWWKAATHAALEHPILGLGTGSSRTMLANDAGVQAAIARYPELPREAFLPAHPHSMYLQTACELGVVGLAALGLVIVTIARASWRAAAERPIRAALAAAIALWAVAAAFEALHMSGCTACLLGALVALVVVPYRHRNEPATRACGDG